MSFRLIGRDPASCGIKDRQLGCGLGECTEDQERAATNSGQATTPARHKQLAAPRVRLRRCSLACGLSHQQRRSRSPASHHCCRRYRCRNISPHPGHRIPCALTGSGQQRHGHKRARRGFDPGGAPDRCILSDTLATVSYPKSTTFQNKFGHRGDLRTSCCGAHTATHGQKCMTLVRSCSERAGGRRRP